MTDLRHVTRVLVSAMHFLFIKHGTPYLQLESSKSPMQFPDNITLLDESSMTASMRWDSLCFNRVIFTHMPTLTHVFPVFSVRSENEWCIHQNQSCVCCYIFFFHDTLQFTLYLQYCSTHNVHTESFISCMSDVWLSERHQFKCVWLFNASL